MVKLPLDTSISFPSIVMLSTTTPALAVTAPVNVAAPEEAIVSFLVAEPPVKKWISPPLLIPSAKIERSLELPDPVRLFSLKRPPASELPSITLISDAFNLALVVISPLAVTVELNVAAPASDASNSRAVKLPPPSESLRIIRRSSSATFV